VIAEEGVRKFLRKMRNTTQSVSFQKAVSCEKLLHCHNKKWAIELRHLHTFEQSRPVLPTSLRCLGFVVVLIGCLCVPVSGMAQAKNSLPSAAFDLYKEGKYDVAAARGLSDLLAQPWNHQLRLVVADSLQRLGQIAEARIQLEALDGTSAAQEAKTRLNSLLNSTQGVRANSSAPLAVEMPQPVATSMPVAPVVSVVPDLVPFQVVESVPAQLSPSIEPVSLPVLLPMPVLTPIAASGQPVVTPSGVLLQLAPFQYIPPVGARLADQVEQPNRSPELQRIMDLSMMGDYQAVVTEGSVLQGKGGLDDELKLIFANSLAWTGRLPEATQAYQGLTTGKFAKEAHIGLANIDRWLGYDHRAAPVYRSVIAIDPENSDALQGLELTSRELSPRTMIGYAGSNDSSDLYTRTLTANHRWRDSTGANIMEIETSHFKGSLPTSESEQRDATFRYKALEREYKPNFEVSVAGGAVYGGAGVALGERPILVEAGLVNWGRFTTNPNALSAKLSASHVGLQASQDFSFGKLVGRVDGYGISDGNFIATSSLRLSPVWRPLGSHFKPLLGIETRDAKFNTTNYWSPAQGYGSVYAGLLGEWGNDDWSLYASGQAGRPLYGEAGASWSWSAGGRRWLSTDVAISLSLWGLSNQRDNAPYRANTFALNLEKLWR
jgi:hypothetical protein